MSRPDETPFEIHVHGDVPLREDVVYEQIQEALKPLWQYAGGRSLAAAAESSYEDEPGIRFDAETHTLQICWTVNGDEDFRQAVEDACMGLNEIASAGAPLEVSFYDTEFDEEDDGAQEEARDDFLMCFVGPTPAAIMQVQRDLLLRRAGEFDAAWQATARPRTHGPWRSAKTPTPALTSGACHGSAGHTH